MQTYLSENLDTKLPSIIKRKAYPILPLKYLFKYKEMFEDKNVVKTKNVEVKNILQKLF